MKYKIRYIEYKGEIREIAFDFEKPYELLSFFISDDVGINYEWIEKKFNKVLLGETDYLDIGGNVCSLEMTPTTTKVYNELEPDDEKYYATMCEVDTRELLKLAEECSSIIREFRRKRDNGESEKEEQQE